MSHDVGADTGFRKGWGGGRGVCITILSTKTQHIRAHMRDFSPLFMEFGGGGGGGGGWLGVRS